jgi:hypothetical protein
MKISMLGRPTAVLIVVFKGLSREQETGTTLIKWNWELM